MSYAQTLSKATKPIAMKSVIDAVEYVFAIEPHTMFVAHNKRGGMNAYKAFYWVCNRAVGHTAARVASRVGRHRSTIAHLVVEAECLIACDPQFRSKIDAVWALLCSGTRPAPRPAVISVCDASSERPIEAGLGEWTDDQLAFMNARFLNQLRQEHGTEIAQAA